MKLRLFIGQALVLLCFAGSAAAQNICIKDGIRFDTSYTVYSAYNKYKAKYPQISIAAYKPKNTLKIKYDQVYQKYSGRKMHLDLYSSDKKQEKVIPCMVLIHGGGWSSGNKFELQNYALALADTGYIAVCVEYRLSPEALYPAGVNDIQAALSWIVENRKKFGIDTSRIAVMGASAGGQLAALIGNTSQSGLFSENNKNKGQKIRINALIDIDGVLAFLHPLSQEGLKPGSAAEKWFGVHFKTDSSKWIQASALSYAGEKTPCSLFIASSFPRFTAGREEMVKILNRFGIYTETHVFDDAPHSFWLFNPWFEPTWEYILQFLKKHN